MTAVAIPIDYFNKRTGNKLSYGEPRRNIVTEGVNLNDLVGVRFRVGEVLPEGVKLCEPCAYLANLVAKEVLPVLVNRGGLRAQVLITGTIKASDAVDATAW